MYNDYIDILDIESGGRDEFVLSGSYRDNLKDKGEYFEYDIVDMPNKSFGSVINNLIDSVNNIVIKTKYNLKFKIKGYIVTQDDELWQIERVLKDTTKNKENLRVLKDNPSAEFVIGATRVANPMGLK